jgi:hypothetical protein
MRVLKIIYMQGRSINPMGRPQPIAVRNLKMLLLISVIKPLYINLITNHIWFSIILYLLSSQS